MKRPRTAPWAELLSGYPSMHLRHGHLRRHAVLLQMTKVYTVSVIEITANGKTAFVTKAFFGPAQKWNTQKTFIYSGPDLAAAIEAHDAIIKDKTKVGRSSGAYTELLPPRYRDPQVLFDALHHLDVWRRKDKQDPDHIQRLWRSFADDDLHLGNDTDLRSLPKTEAARNLPDDAWQMLNGATFQNEMAIAKLQAAYTRDALNNVKVPRKPKTEQRFGL